MEIENSNSMDKMAIRGRPNHEPTSIVITHIPTDTHKRDIETFFGEIGRVRRCHLVRDKDWQFKGMAYVQYVSSEIAARAKEHLNRKLFRGSALRVKFSRNKKKEEVKLREKKKIEKKRLNALNEEHYSEEWQVRHQNRRAKNRSKYDFNKDARKKRKGRIIIRNLSFQVNEKLLEEHFSPYGKINEIKIVRKDKEKIAGYAFLQYETRIQALKATQECNMKPLLGRPVVIDLAVPKKMYEAQTVKIKDEIKEEDSIKEEIGEKSAIKKEELSDDNDSGLEDNEVSDSEDDDDDDDNYDDDDDESDSEDEGKRKGKPARKPEPTMDPSKDVAEERTVFIKNLSFDATEEDISSVLSQYGELKYVILCMDPLTEHPRGTAFAQFKKKEGAVACLAAESDIMTKSLFVLLGRQMHIMKAISRGNLQDKKKEEESDKKVKDKRNLYLAREGFIRVGTQAAVGVSQADIELRQMRERSKRRLLKNLNAFISKTRLCINNLPESLTDYELRRLFLRRGEPDSKITEARVMRILNELSNDGTPMSRGYGFVNFTQHEHALAALRRLNNNPDIFTDAKRPVIEFSVENLDIIRAREKRMEKSREKNPLYKKGKNAENLQQKENKWQSKKKSTKSNVEASKNESFMGSKADPGVGVKNALPANIGPKVRQREKTGKITRNQLRKQRNDRRKGRKRVRTNDNTSEEPDLKKAKGEGTTTKKKKKTNKKNNNKLPKNLRIELRKDKSFNDMVKQYKQKMSSVNSESSSKRWFDD